MWSSRVNSGRHRRDGPARKEVAGGGVWRFLRLRRGSDGYGAPGGTPGTRPPPLSACTGPSCGARAHPCSLRSPRSETAALSLPNLSLSLSSSRAGPGRGAGSPGPYPEPWGCATFSLGRGARWGGGDLGREGLLQKGRGCKSVAGGRPGKASASQMSAPGCSETHEAASTPCAGGPGRARL